MATPSTTSLRWIEAIVILTMVLAGVSLYKFTKEYYQKKSSSTPKAEDYIDKKKRFIQQIQIERVESKINQYKQIRQKKETQQFETEINLVALEAKEPWLSRGQPIQPTPLTTIIKDQYVAAKKQVQFQAIEISHIDSQLANLQEQLFSLTTAKADSAKAAVQQLKRAHEEAANRLQKNIIQTTALNIGVLLLVLYLFLRWKDGENSFQWRLGVVFYGTVALLAILFAYEAFGLAVIGFISIMVLFIGLLLIPRDSST
ncbi:hypothetical protein EXU85_11115 [Spirosoma sp. KCTC 42546]|uniref:hypothetical protein n=1 Tax=Spirosoma sp. KCTC 42546 TaxID=2520506 RepID=UPI001158CC61|nr:hypothetical protein [Spirosoma sp. KCTC 42546]QDK79125.1 hypothetical protein EXU85_11115 [Spirosoma sp. KCTC 42546]